MHPRHLFSKSAGMAAKPCHRHQLSDTALRIVSSQQPKPTHAHSTTPNSERGGRHSRPSVRYTPPAYSFSRCPLYRSARYTYSATLFARQSSSPLHTGRTSPWRANAHLSMAKTPTGSIHTAHTPLNNDHHTSTQHRTTTSTPAPPLMD